MRDWNTQWTRTFRRGKSVQVLFLKGNDEMKIVYILNDLESENDN